MKENHDLEDFNLIIIRYNPEIWLKSMKVKIRMLKILMNNIKKMLQLADLKFNKYQLSKDSSRIFFFFKNEDIPRAIKVLKMALGVQSLSPALRTSHQIKNITEKAIQVCGKVLGKGDTFAVRVKRSGRHEYSSRDVAVKVGQAILDNFKKLNLKVNLTTPKKIIFIEVRNEFSYIFTSIIKSKWSGLPVDINKKILVMDIGRLNDLLAGFLLMKRGCTLYPILFDISMNSENMEDWISNWKEILKFLPFSSITVLRVNFFKLLKIVHDELENNSYLCAICRFLRFLIISKIIREKKINGFHLVRAISDGVSLNSSTLCFDGIDLQSITFSSIFSNYPILTPLIGFKLKKIEQLKNGISKNLNYFRYCAFKPKNQQIDKEGVKKLYRLLKIDYIIEDTLQKLKEITISN